MDIICEIVTHVPTVHTSRLPLESVRERLVASWTKAVASAVSTTQHPKPSVTEKAPLLQPSKRASFFKGTLEQARLAGLTDEEIASIGDALKPELEKEVWRLRPFRETWGAVRSMKLTDNQTRKSRAGTVIES